MIEECKFSKVRLFISGFVWYGIYGTEHHSRRRLVEAEGRGRLSVGDTRLRARSQKYCAGVEFWGSAAIHPAVLRNEHTDIFGLKVSSQR